MTFPWTNAGTVSHTFWLSFLVLLSCSKHRTSQGGLIICCSSSHSPFWSVQSSQWHWQALTSFVGFAPGVSVARQAPPLIIMVWVLCVGSCLPVTSHTGPCLTASHSLESANWHDRTEYLSLAWPNQAKGPNYQIRILQAFSKNLFFPALSRALTCLSHSSAYDIFT